MRVQRVLMPDSETESWTVLGDDHVAVAPIERYLAYLAYLAWGEKSPNTVKAYAHDLKDWFVYLTGCGLDWQSVTLEEVAGFVGWLRLPPQARDGKVTVLPTADHHCAESSVNRKLAALSSFCEFHTRHGVPLGDLMVTMRPAGRRGRGSSYKPFLEHIAKSRPQKARTIRLRQPRRRPVVLSAGDAQAVLDGCEHLRDRLLFALLLDTGLRIGEALGLRHEDIALAERQVSVIPRPNANRVRAKSGRSREVPASAELMRLYADYLNREYGALDSDYVFVNLWGRPHGRPLTYSAVYDLVERLRRRTGIDFEPHQFRATDKDWVAVRPRVAKASRMVNGVFRLWSEQLDLIAEHGTDFDAGAMWRALETEIGPREEVETAAALLDELLPPGADETEAEMRRLLATRYNTVRPFLSLLGESSALGAASGGKRVLEGVKRLPALARRKVKVKPLLPREIDQKLVPAAWKRAVYSNPELPEGVVDRDAYVVCVLEQLYRALNRRDVFAAPSNRWSDPRARLLDGRQWEAVAEDVLHGLSLDEPVEEHLAGRVRALDAAWQLMAERLEEAGQDAKLSFEIQPNGRLKLNVDRLGAVGESKSLRWLRQTTAAMLPKIDLPDLLFEVDSWTGFLDAFVHLGDGRTRMENLKTFPGGAAGRRGVQHRFHPRYRRERRGVDPGPTGARRPVLPAGGHHRRGERPPDRGPGPGSDRGALE